MAAPDFLKITAFCNKVYYVKIFVLDVTKKNLSRDSTYIVDVVM